MHIYEYIFLYTTIQNIYDTTTPLFELTTLRPMQVEYISHENNKTKTKKGETAALVKAKIKREWEIV